MLVGVVAIATGVVFPERGEWIFIVGFGHTELAAICLFYLFYEIGGLNGFAGLRRYRHNKFCAIIANALHYFMLVFIDESGDTGRKIDQGSSRYFVVSLVLFEENDEALSCDQRIALLRKEWRVPEMYEFKFSRMNREQRETFLHAVLPYSFIYFSIVINKDPAKLRGDGFFIKESFYKYACFLVFENAKPYLRDATVIIDGSGTREFKNQLQSYLKRNTASIPCGNAALDCDSSRRCQFRC